VRLRIEGILYTLTELLLLRELVPHIAHRPATLHDLLLSLSERPADTATPRRCTAEQSVGTCFAWRTSFSAMGESARERRRPRDRVR
jgi:hypothetical protein